jgi:hypothetical protein
MAGLAELAQDGQISDADIAATENVRDEMARLNGEGDTAAMRVFAERFNEDNYGGKIRFELMRGDKTLIPAVDLPKRDTTRLRMALGPKDKAGSNRFGPPLRGAACPNAPIRTERMNEKGNFDDKAFAESPKARLETAVPKGE